MPDRPDINVSPESPDPYEELMRAYFPSKSSPSTDTGTGTAPTPNLDFNPPPGVNLDTYWSERPEPLN